MSVSIKTRCPVSASYGVDDESNRDIPRRRQRSQSLSAQAHTEEPLNLCCEGMETQNSDS